MKSAAAFACLLALASCETIPRPRTGLEYLAFARAALDRGEPEEARFLLETVDEGSFSDQDLARYKVLLAEAYVRVERFWDAYQTLESFSRRFPTSEYRSRAELLEYEAGRQLAASGWTFFGIVSDLDNARKVLEHFLTAFPRTRYLPDALRILGEAAYQTGDYDLAIQRFSQLAQRRPGSAWADLAAFRIAMSHFMLVEGPDYDAGALTRARKELAGYLESDTTNDAFLRQAGAALARTLLWIEEKQLAIARFYLRVDKPAGARVALETLLADPDAKRRSEARALMHEVERVERAQAGGKGGP